MNRVSAGTASRLLSMFVVEPVERHISHQWQEKFWNTYSVRFLCERVDEYS
jgi:hypothetical protein